jgi:hypothetical protein
VRIGAAYAYAIVRIRELRGLGQEPRTDGFFDQPEDGRGSDAEELLEAVMLAAGSASQERKVPYIGRLFGSLAFRPDISPGYGHFLARLANRLTYRQFVATAFIGAEQSVDKLVRLDSDRQYQGHWSFSERLGPELDELADLAIIGIETSDRRIVKPSGRWAGGDIENLEALGNLRLMEMGRDLYDLMGLAQISTDEQERIYGLMSTAPEGWPTSG